MPLSERSQSATEEWEAFALASTAPLGVFHQVSLAPKFSPAKLNAALATYLALQEDELLLAIIDRGGRKATGRCALTSRRIYWIEKDDREEPAARAQRRWLGHRARIRLVVRVAAYGDLPKLIGVIEAPAGSFAIDFGRGNTIKLGRVGAQLPRALARYLEMMSRAARAGTVPEGLIDPDLAARASRVMPKVAKATADARVFGHDVGEFFAALQSATPRALMTMIMTAACIIAYLAMVASKVDWLWPSPPQLIRWGANYGVDIALGHEYWRLFTNVFVHFGLIHLALNMWNLIVIGPLVERLYGNVAFAVIYLASGIGGSIASFATSPHRVGVGASGAICGVLGGLVAFLVVHRQRIPRTILKSFKTSLIWVVVSMAILGYLIPNIDHQAHLGGFVSGFLAGLLLSRSWPVVKSRSVTMRLMAGTLVIAGALAVTALAVSRRASAALPPGIRLQAMSEEFLAIASASPKPLADFDNQQARARNLRKIKALSARAIANLAALRRAASADRSVQSKANVLIEAQATQLAALQAEQRFLETGEFEAVAPAIRLQVFMDQISPAIEDYDGIAEASASTLVLRRDLGDPQASAGHLKSTREFIGRSVENLTTLGRVSTPDPVLKEMLKSFIEAQSGQLAGLRATERFLETGDPQNLNGEGGVLEAITAAKKAVQAFREQQTRFLRDNNLIPAHAEP
jgi:rhomboid protease GluP